MLLCWSFGSFPLSPLLPLAIGLLSWGHKILKYITDQPALTPHEN